MCPRVWILCVLVSILRVSYACTSRRIQIRSKNDSGTKDGEMKMSGCEGGICSLRIENNVNVKITCRNVSKLERASAQKLKNMNITNLVILIEIINPSDRTINNNNNTITYDNQSKQLTFILRDVKTAGNYGIYIKMEHNLIKADECTVILDVKCTDDVTTRAPDEEAARAPDKEAARAPDKEAARDTYNSPVWPGIVTVVLLIVMLCVGAYFFRKRRRNRQMNQYHEAEPCVSHPEQEIAVCPNCQCSLNVDI